MPEARMLRSALKDINDIWLYIARDNINAADKLVASVEAATKRLANMPGIGRKRDELQPDLLSYPLGNYVIFYQRSSVGIDVLHVYHGARNFEELF